MNIFFVLCLFYCIFVNGLFLLKLCFRINIRLNIKIDEIQIVIREL